MRDLFPEDWKPNIKRFLLGLDAWVDFSVFRSASGLRETYERFSTFMDRFHVSGWRRGLNEIVSEGATLGTVGLLSFGLGFLGLSILTAWWCISRLISGLEPIHLHERAVFYYSITGLILGAQFISIGFLAEMINARSHKQTDGYSVAERTGEP